MSHTTTTIPTEYHKVLVLGGSKTGKKTLIENYAHKPFTLHTRCHEIRVDFALKDIGHGMVLQIWSMDANQLEKAEIGSTPVVGALILFDVAIPDTFHTIGKMKALLHRYVGSVPIVLVANKIDKVINNYNHPWHLNKKCMDIYCRNHGYEGWLEVSSLEKVDAERAFYELVRTMLFK